MVTELRILLLSILISGFLVGTASALAVEAIAGQDQVALGESLQLQLRLDGRPDAEPDFTLLQQSWEILGRSQSSQTRIINGSVSRSTIYSLTLMPRSEGQLMIPSICFGEDCSRPVPIEVSSVSSLDNPPGEQVLIETEISSHEVMALGQLLLKVRLYVKLGLPIGQLSNPQPIGVNALINKLGPDVNSREKRDNGHLYQVIESSYVIFPQESGQMLIPALHYDGLIPGISTRFDPFARQGMQVRITSKPIEVEVLPIPEDLGQRPWIPATALFLQDDWQQHPPTLEVGKPATRTLRLRAEGILSAQLPELKLTAPAEFKLYFGQPRREDQRLTSGTTGVMEQQITLVPTQPGHYLLPAVDLDWWDVTAGEWRTAHLDPLKADVAPASAAAPPITQGFPETPQPQPSMPSTGPEPTRPDPLVSSAEQRVTTVAGFWPWLSSVLAIGWFVTLILYLRKGEDKKTPALNQAADGSVNEKNARHAAIQAARNNDPQATRHALVLWSQAMWPDMPGNRYEHLSRVAGPGLRTELETLDRALYGKSGTPWDGRPLAEFLAAWRKGSTKGKSSELPDLYPHGE